MKKRFIREQGFTLIELLVALAVAAIIVSMAAPSFVEVIDNNRVTTAANDFSASLALAKIEAVKRNRSVKIVAKESGGVKDWELGYVIGVDLNGDDDFADTVSGVSETTLKSIDAFDDTVVVVPVGPGWDDVAVAAPMVIEFNSLGGLDTTGNVAFDSTRDACRRSITLNASGVYTMHKEDRPCTLADL